MKDDHGIEGGREGLFLAKGDKTPRSAYRHCLFYGLKYTLSAVFYHAQPPNNFTASHTHTHTQRESEREREHTWNPRIELVHCIPCK